MSSGVSTAPTPERNFSRFSNGRESPRLVLSLALLTLIFMTITPHNMPVGFITPAQANSNEYFVQCTSGGNVGPWLCKLCTGRTFIDRNRHSRLKTHIDRVRVNRERCSSLMMAPGLGSRASEDSSVNLHQHPPEIVPEDTGVPDVPSPIGDDIDTNDLFDEDIGSSSDELESLYGLSPPKEVDFPGSRESSVDLDDILDAMSDSESSSTGAENKQSVITETWLPWYPLRKKEVCIVLVSHTLATHLGHLVDIIPFLKIFQICVKHAAALLMLGTGCNLMSTAEYTRI
ncbi:hypothetical protein DFH28DRAFT_924545 [Melampsora americana]|nr:hypothetical protein DFH28DRAFT_924545 [Melampsora americana]